jgi:hypothetical protein
VIKNLLITLTVLFSVSFATEIYFGNVDQNAGTADILYSTDLGIGGFQFNFIGGTISGSSGGEAATSGFTVSESASTILGFSFSGASLAIGEGLTLLTVEFEPNEDVTEFCLDEVVLSDVGGSNISFNVGACAEAFQLDCNGELGGTAVEDECGVCEGDGVMQDCGCGASGEFEMPDGECDCEGNIEDICGDCGGTGETLNDCVEGYGLFFENLDQVNGTVDVVYAAESPIGGAQFTVSGITITGASGGEAENIGWTVSSSETTWIGFSFSAQSIPSGLNTLTTLTFESPGEGTELCFTNPVFSDSEANPLIVELGECLPLFNYDCNGELGGSAELDECGICEGDGVQQDCGCGTAGDFGYADGACDCEGNVEDICGDCGGTGETLEDCVEGYSIYFENLNQVAGTVDVYYASESEIGGAQFSVEGITITGSGGGISEELGWSVNESASTWLGFSFNNVTLPAGIQLLTSLTFTAPGEGDELCLENPILSSPSADPYDVDATECLTLFDYDCNSELGGNAEVDECGICEGNGVIQECGCGITGEFEIPAGDCDCDGNVEDECGECGGNGASCAPGTFDILYNIDVEFGGFQFQVNGTTVTSADGGVSEELNYTVQAGASGTVLGFSFEAVPIPAGEGLLVTIHTEGPNEDACISDLVISDMDANSLDAFIVDCNTITYCEDLDEDNICDAEDDCVGIVDDCGVCNGNNDSMDECGVCDGSGVIQECGCGAPGEFVMPAGDCDCDGNVEDICGDCGGTGETLDDCVEGYTIYFDNLNQVAGTVDVYYASESPIGGAQFNVTGISMTSSSGGEAELQGWTVSTTETIWLGFSMNNTPLPAGTRLLSSIQFTAPGIGSELCFNNVILSSTDADPFDVVVGDCLELQDYDCNGELGGSAELDECGVCDGSGADYECWEGSLECSEADCPLGASLSFGEQEGNTIPVYISSNSDISGFQFNVSGTDIISAFGGIAEESGFTLQAGNGVILAFSFEGLFIPAGDHLLVNLELGQFTESELCFVEDSGVISDPEANSLLVVFGDCMPVTLSNSKYQSISEFSLNDIYPNPFNAQTTISYSVPVTEFIDVSVFDINGQKVQILETGTKNIGHHKIHWDAGDIPSGVYFVKLTTNNIVKTQLITLMK